MIPKDRLGWCAGFIDGDGSISILKNVGSRRGHTVVIRVAVTSEAAAQELRRTFGTGIIRSYTRPPPRKRYWRWYVGKTADVQRVLSLLHPYLVVKQREAELALRFIAGEDTVAECRSLKHHRWPGSRRRSHGAESTSQPA